MTRWIVPPLRRTVQAISLIILVLLPLLALHAHYKEARAIDDLPKNQWRGAAIHLIDATAEKHPHAYARLLQSQGTFWSARLLGVSLTDPLAGAEAILSSRSLYGPLLVSLLIPVAVTLILGRVFCGWICPVNTLLELVDRARRVLGWLELPVRDLRFSLQNKYLVLAILLSVVALSGVPCLAMIYPPAVFSREVHTIVFAGGAGLGLYLLLAVVAMELFVSRRWWCRYICPGGALYALLSRFRLVRVRRDTARCTSCGDCVRACQFDVRPMLVQITGMECTNCARCITTCSTGALEYRLVLPLGRRCPPARPAATPHAATGPPVEQAVAEKGERVHVAKRSSSPIKALAPIVLVLVPSSATAHHILGLPHYSYKENYPQAPTLEYPATTGPYDVLMTSYPGQPTPGEAATVAFYIKNRYTNRPYEQPVEVQVLKTSTFGRNTIVYPPTRHEPFDNQHKFTVTFPEHGEYIVELDMQVEGRREIIPFLVVAGEPSGTGYVVASIVVGCVFCLVVVRAIQVKRRRQQRSSRPLSPSPPDSERGWSWVQRI